MTLDLFIKCTEELKEGAKDWQPDSSATNEADEELPPLMASRSVSLPLTPNQTKAKPQNSSLLLIKSLVSLLHVNESSQQQKKQITHSSHFKETESHTKYLSQMWSLVLKSLTAVSVNQLIEAKIFDALVNAFLVSSEEIKQITYPQILNITEIIATQSVHTSDISKFICNLLFITLDNVTDNHHERVGYSIC